MYCLQGQPDKSIKTLTLYKDYTQHGGTLFFRKIHPIFSVTHLSSFKHVLKKFCINHFCTCWTPDELKKATNKAGNREKENKQLQIGIRFFSEQMNGIMQIIFLLLRSIFTQIHALYIFGEYMEYFYSSTKMSFSVTGIEAPNFNMKQ